MQFQENNILPSSSSGYSQNEGWDLLDDYLKKNYSIDTSSIIKFGYKYEYSLGQELKCHEGAYQKYKKILLFVEIGNTAETELFGQLFFYEEDRITLHHNFNIETICRLLDRAFPKETLEPISLSPEEQQKRKENIIQRLKGSIRQHQNTMDAEQLKEAKKYQRFFLDLYKESHLFFSRIYHPDKVKNLKESNLYEALLSYPTLSTPCPFLPLNKYKDSLELFIQENDWFSHEIANKILPINDLEKLSIILPLQNLSGVITGAAIILRDSKQTDNLMVQNKKYLNHNTLIVSDLRKDTCTQDINKVKHYCIVTSIEDGLALLKSLPNTIILFCLNEMGVKLLIDQILAVESNIVSVFLSNPYQDILNRTCQEVPYYFCEIYQTLKELKKNRVSIFIPCIDEIFSSWASAKNQLTAKDFESYLYMHIKKYQLRIKEKIPESQFFDEIHTAYAYRILQELGIQVSSLETKLDTCSNEHSDHNVVANHKQVETIYKENQVGDIRHADKKSHYSSFIKNRVLSKN